MQASLGAVDKMSAEKLFDVFYAVPNAHFNAFFEAATGAAQEPHPLAGLAPNTETCETAAPAVAGGVDDQLAK